MVLANGLPGVYDEINVHTAGTFLEVVSLKLSKSLISAGCLKF